MPVTEDAENLPRPAPTVPEAPTSQPGDSGRQAPVLSAHPPVAPSVPLPAPTAASAPLGALQAADPAAPSAAAERAIVGGSVPAQSEGSATTDVQGQPALPASPAPPSAPPPTLAPPPPVQAGSAPALPVAVPPAPPVVAPPAPPVGAPLAPAEVAPVAPPVVAPPAPHVAGPSAPPVAAPVAPPVANPSVPPAQRPQSPGRRQQRPQSPARQDEHETSRRRHNSPRRRDQPVTMADLQRAVSAAVREERNGQARQSNSPRVAQTPVAPPPTAHPAQATPRPPAIVPPPHVPLTAAGGPVTAQYPSLLPVDPPPPSAGAAHSFSALLGPQCPVAVPEGDSLVGGPRDDCFAAADRLAELLAPVLAAPALGGLAGVGPLGSAVRGLRRLLHAGTGSGAIAAGTVLVRELHRTLSGLLAVFDADQM
ncbi:unnamed protein product [Closterium sp. Naga37s-1]|nr:unnamed protein product [Closterium sp. Naga37s-1]